MTTAQDQQSRAELLPCPFCGDKPDVIPSHDADGCFWSWVQCGQCGARTQGAWVSNRADTCPIFYEGVREEWNQRALPAGMEPVGSVYTIFALVPGGREMAHVTLHKHLPAGTKLYTAAQVQAMGRVPPGWQAVPVKCPTAICCAIEREIDSQLAASGIAAPMHRQDGTQVWDEALAAAPRPPAAQEVVSGPCGQCKDSRQPCNCAIDTMLQERGSVAVSREHYLALSKQAKAAQESKPLTVDQIEQALQGHTLAEGWLERMVRAIEAAHGIKEGGGNGAEPG